MIEQKEMEYNIMIMEINYMKENLKMVFLKEMEFIITKEEIEFMMVNGKMENQMEKEQDIMNMV